MELRERLRLALGQAGAASSARVSGRSASPRRDVAQTLAALPALRPAETGRGPAYVIDQTWPLSYRHGGLCLGDALALAERGLARLAPGLTVSDLAAAAFIDVETTGLAGGTGTYVFLVGIGTFERDSFRVRQFFLADVGAEPAMLDAVTGVLGGRPAFVSFNGRRFDLPLLATRLTLNGLAPLPDIQHLDLLYPARRLYRRRLPSCRLGTLEESLLGLTREDDVPGWLVPSLYIDYVRAGRAGPLRAVFRHNALDILSLVTLLACLGRAAGDCASAEAEDYLALGRWDESDGRLAEAAIMYAAAAEDGGPVGVRSTARLRLARLCRRLGRIEDAACLWRQEAEGGGPLEGRLEALIELAKLEEHRRQEFAAAEALARRALNLLDIAAIRNSVPTRSQFGREAVEHRLRRLSRRLAATGRVAR